MVGPQARRDQVELLCKGGMDQLIFRIPARFYQTLRS